MTLKQSNKSISILAIAFGFWNAHSHTHKNHHHRHPHESFYSFILLRLLLWHLLKHFYLFIYIIRYIFSPFIFYFFRREDLVPCFLFFFRLFGCFHYSGWILNRWNLFFIGNNITFLFILYFLRKNWRKEMEFGWNSVVRPKNLSFIDWYLFNMFFSHFVSSNQNFQWLHRNDHFFWR